MKYRNLMVDDSTHYNLACKTTPSRENVSIVCHVKNCEELICKRRQTMETKSKTTNDGNEITWSMALNELPTTKKVAATLESRLHRPDPQTKSICEPHESGTLRIISHHFTSSVTTERCASTRAFQQYGMEKAATQISQSITLAHKKDPTFPNWRFSQTTSLRAYRFELWNRRSVRARTDVCDAGE